MSFMLLDNSFLKMDFETDRIYLVRREKYLWVIYEILGFIVTVILFIIFIFLVSKIGGYL